MSPEKAMAPHSSTLAWKLPWMEDLGGLQSMGLLRVGQTEWLPFHFSLSCIGEGNGNQLQCSCLENVRDGGAWWAAVYGVTQSLTWLKWLSSSSSRTLAGASQVVLVVKNPPANARDPKDASSIPGSGRSLGIGNGTSSKYSCLENSMDRGA